MDRVVRDGNVAVLYSPRHGAGWYTWNQFLGNDAIFDPELVFLVEKGNEEDTLEYISRRFPDAYVGGVKNLSIEWVPVGTEFVITEYDGYESIECKADYGWIVA
jgi:hypothetical protein